MTTYRPLPPEARLGFSDIEGIGTFAKKNIERGHDFGICHLQVEKELFRTPLGGFLNHSDDPNCTKSMFRVHAQNNGTGYKTWRLFALDDIKEGEELTVTYTFYKI